MGAEQIARTVGDQQWLDGVASQLQEGIRKLFESGGRGGRQAKNLLHGSALGHPLHPALIALPVGAWTLAAIFDAIELAGGDDRDRIADRAIGIGILGALAAAVAGVTDWSETDGRAKRIGLTHGAMNVAAVGLYAWSLYLRKRSRSKGISVGMLAFGVSMSSAFLGGHLAYGEQIGVDHAATADQGKPEKYLPVIDKDKLVENKPIRVTADGVNVLLVRQADKIFALRETCTHLGGPLAEGKVEADGIRCPWHGSRFCLRDGRVLDGPAVFPERVFDVRVRDGRVEVRAEQRP